MTKAGKRSLHTLPPEATRLGQPTVVSKSLAGTFGSPYVHMTVLAVDLDRLSDVAEGLPRGWEVFLLEHAWKRCVPVTLRGPMAAAIIDDVCDLEAPLEVLGVPLLFALADGTYRQLAPKALRDVLGEAGIRIDTLRKRLDPWWQRPQPLLSELCQAALRTPLDPPIASTSTQLLGELCA